eukprot:m.808982 g.808982  ORF g.808982 m.808982 type:complete len:178 (-) comp23381_c1_seq58:2657-3190(-)
MLRHVHVGICHASYPSDCACVVICVPQSAPVHEVDVDSNTVHIVKTPMNDSEGHPHRRNHAHTNDYGTRYEDTGQPTWTQVAKSEAISNAAENDYGPLRNPRPPRRVDNDGGSADYAISASADGVTLRNPEYNNRLPSGCRLGANLITCLFSSMIAALLNGNRTELNLSTPVMTTSR